jgi:carbonic anhydrase
MSKVESRTKLVPKPASDVSIGPAVTNVPHDECLEKLKAGNERFLKGTSEIQLTNTLNKLKEQAAKGQKPHTIILSCADSRAPVEMLFDQDLGDVFVIRVAGNIVNPSVIGSIEYAVASFGTQLVVVMGHTLCGAVKATVDNIGTATGVPTEAIHDIVTRIKPNIFNTCKDCGIPKEELMTRCVEANTLASVHELTNASRLLERSVAKGRLRIVGSVFDLNNGEVYFLEEEEDDAIGSGGTSSAASSVA